MKTKFPRMTLVVLQTFKKSPVKDGHLLKEENEIEWSKTKFLEMRHKVLDIQQNYACPHTDNEIGNMERHAILKFL